MPLINAKSAPNLSIAVNWLCRLALLVRLLLRVRDQLFRVGTRGTCAEPRKTGAETHLLGGSDAFGRRNGSRVGEWHTNGPLRDT